MADIFIPTLHTFAMKNPFTGSCGALRFKIVPNVEMATPKEVDFETIEPLDTLNEGTASGRGFAVSGGVAKAVADLAHETNPDREIKTACAEGLRDCRKLMMMAKAGKYNGYLLEGMACPGGCVAGAGTLLPVDLAAKVVGRYQGETDRISPMDSEYRNQGEKLD